MMLVSNQLQNTSKHNGWPQASHLRRSSTRVVFPATILYLAPKPDWHVCVRWRVSSTDERPESRSDQVTMIDDKLQEAVTSASLVTR